MSDLLDRVPATIPGLVQPGMAVYSSRDLLTGRIVEGEAGGLLVWCPTEGDGNVHAFDVGDWDSVDLTDRTSRVHAAWWCEEQQDKADHPNHPNRFTDNRRVLTIAKNGEPMDAVDRDTLARLVLRLADGVDPDYDVCTIDIPNDGGDW